MACELASRLVTCLSVSISEGKSMTLDSVTVKDVHSADRVRDNKAAGRDNSGSVRDDDWLELNSLHFVESVPWLLIFDVLVVVLPRSIVIAGSLDVVAFREFESSLKRFGNVPPLEILAVRSRLALSVPSDDSLEKGLDESLLTVVDDVPPLEALAVRPRRLLSVPNDDSLVKGLLDDASLLTVVDDVPPLEALAVRPRRLLSVPNDDSLVKGLLDDASLLTVLDDVPLLEAPTARPRLAFSVPNDDLLLKGSLDEASLLTAVDNWFVFCSKSISARVVSLLESELSHISLPSVSNWLDTRDV